MKTMLKLKLLLTKADFKGVQGHFHGQKTGSKRAFKLADLSEKTVIILENVAEIVTK